MKPQNAQEIVKRIKARDRGKKVNTTFRLSEETIKNFKRACERQGVRPGEVIEELMSQFVQSAT